MSQVEIYAYSHIVQVTPTGFQITITHVGTSGPAGQDGTSLRHGTVDPDSSIGNDGDFYINTSTYTLFGPKNTTWPAGVPLIPSQGSIQEADVWAVALATGY